MKPWFASWLVLGACAEDLPTGSAALDWKRILFVGVRSDDQGAQVDWYTASLGFALQGDVWFVFDDGSSLEVLPDGVGSSGTKGPAEQPFVVSLLVADFDAHVGALVDRGVTFVDGVEADGTRFVELADPEGNQLRMRPSDHDADGEGYLSIAWSGLTVSDVDEAVGWYRDVLGLAPDGSTAFRLANGTTLEILGGGTPSDATKTAAQQSTVLGFELTNLDAAIAELATRGAAVGGDIYEWASDTLPDERWIEISDPEGNEMLIKEVTD